MLQLLGLPFLCGAFVILWSSGFIGAKFGLDYAGTFTILFWRYLLVTAVLALSVTIARQWRPLAAKIIFRHMIVGALAHAVWLVAVFGAIDRGLSTGLVAFITALQPILTGVFSARVTGEKVVRREWYGLALGLVAVAIVVGKGISLGGSAIAYAMPFVAVIAITAASLIDRSATISDEEPTPLLLVTFYHCLATLIFLTPLAIGVENLQAEWNGNLIFAIVWLAIIVTIGAYGLMFLLLRHLPAPKMASLSYLSPPVTMIMAWVLFGEAVTTTAIIGLGIAALGVGLTLSTHTPNSD